MPAKVTVLEFTLPYPPTANTYWRNVNGRMVTSAAARAYKEEVGWTIKTKVKDPLPGDVYVKVKIFRPRKIGDLDNSLKILLDSLKGLIYLDDDQIVEIRASRFDDKTNPRAEITVECRCGDKPVKNTPQANSGEKG
jgi:crossover junction endodeoxyribonuclease RusA